MHLDMYRLCSIEIMILGCSYYNLKNLLTLDQFIALEYISVPHRTRKSPIHNININYDIIDIPRQYQNIKQHLQSKQVKRSSHEWIKFNNFIIANSISGIISIIWLLDEWCKIQIKPEFKTRNLIGLLLSSGARLAWEFDRCINLHNLPRSLTRTTSVICISF